jgi:hypothetical protein
MTEISSGSASERGHIIPHMLLYSRTSDTGGFKTAIEKFISMFSNPRIGGRHTNNTRNMYIIETGSGTNDENIVLLTYLNEISQKRFSYSTCGIYVRFLDRLYRSSYVPDLIRRLRISVSYEGDVEDDETNTDVMEQQFIMPRHAEIVGRIKGPKFGGLLTTAEAHYPDPMFTHLMVKKEENSDILGLVGKASEKETDIEEEMIVVNAKFYYSDEFRALYFEGAHANQEIASVKELLCQIQHEVANLLKNSPMHKGAKMSKKCALVTIENDSQTFPEYSYLMPINKYRPDYTESYEPNAKGIDHMIQIGNFSPFPVKCEGVLGEQDFSADGEAMLYFSATVEMLLTNGIYRNAALESMQYMRSTATLKEHIFGSIKRLKILSEIECGSLGEFNTKNISILIIELGGNVELTDFPTCAKKNQPRNTAPIASFFPLEKERIIHLADEYYYFYNTRQDAIPIDVTKGTAVDSLFCNIFRFFPRIGKLLQFSYYTMPKLRDDYSTADDADYFIYCLRLLGEYKKYKQNPDRINYVTTLIETYHDDNKLPSEIQTRKPVSISSPYVSFDIIYQTVAFFYGQEVAAEIERNMPNMSPVDGRLRIIKIFEKELLPVISIIMSRISILLRNTLALGPDINNPQITYNTRIIQLTTSYTTQIDTNPALMYLEFIAGILLSKIPTITSSYSAVAMFVNMFMFTSPTCMTEAGRFVYPKTCNILSQHAIYPRLFKYSIDGSDFEFTGSTARLINLYSVYKYDAKIAADNRQTDEKDGNGAVDKNVITSAGKRACYYAIALRKRTTMVNAGNDVNPIRVQLACLNNPNKVDTVSHDHFIRLDSVYIIPHWLENVVAMHKLRKKHFLEIAVAEKNKKQDAYHSPKQVTQKLLNVADAYDSSVRPNITLHKINYDGPDERKLFIQGVLYHKNLRFDDESVFHRRFGKLASKLKSLSIELYKVFKRCSGYSNKDLDPAKNTLFGTIYKEQYCLFSITIPFTADLEHSSIKDILDNHRNHVLMNLSIPYLITRYKDGIKDSGKNKTKEGGETKSGEIDSDYTVLRNFIYLELSGKLTTEYVASFQKGEFFKYLETTPFIGASEKPKPTVADNRSPVRPTVADMEARHFMEPSPNRSLYDISSSNGGTPVSFDTGAQTPTGNPVRTGSFSFTPSPAKATAFPVATFGSRQGQMNTSVPHHVPFGSSRPEVAVEMDDSTRLQVNAWRGLYVSTVQSNATTPVQPTEESDQRGISTPSQPAKKIRATKRTRSADNGGNANDGITLAEFDEILAKSLEHSNDVINELRSLIENPYVDDSDWEYFFNTYYDSLLLEPS